MNALPRSICAPFCFTACAASLSCSSLSTAQGPAIIVSSSLPILTPFTLMTVFFGLNSREANWYGASTGTTRRTPFIISSFCWSNSRSFPIAPTTVFFSPSEMNAVSPLDSMYFTIS